jgi:hypothetical protein
MNRAPPLTLNVVSTGWRRPLLNNATRLPRIGGVPTETIDRLTFGFCFSVKRFWKVFLILSMVRQMIRAAKAFGVEAVSI